MVTSSVMTKQEIETAIKVVETEILKTQDMLRALQLIKTNLSRQIEHDKARHAAETTT